MKAVLNEYTGTIHRHRAEKSGLHTECGAAHFVDDDHLETTSLERAITDSDTSKCGRCFDDGGGY
jgi:hypothetical protein